MSLNGSSGMLEFMYAVALVAGLIAGLIKGLKR